MTRRVVYAELRSAMCLAMSKLGITQKSLAEASRVTPSWLSQVLSGGRPSIETYMMERLVNALLIQLESYTGEDRELITRQLQESLASCLENYEPSTPEALQEAKGQEPENLHIAADLLAILIERCSTNLQKRRVIAVLKKTVG